MLRVVIQGLCSVDYTADRIHRIKKEIKKSIVQISGLKFKEGDVTFWCPCDPSAVITDPIVIIVEVIVNKSGINSSAAKNGLAYNLNRRVVSCVVGRSFKTAVSKWERDITQLFVLVRKFESTQITSFSL